MPVSDETYMKIGKAVETLAGELPDDCIVNLKIERGGYDIEVEFSDEVLSVSSGEDFLEDVKDSLELAKEMSEARK